MDTTTSRHGAIWALALCWLAFLAPSQLQALPPLPSTSCLLIDEKEAPVIDGELNEPVWARAEQNALLWGLWGNATDGQSTFRLVCDKKWLYLAVSFPEPDMRADHVEAPNFFLAADPASDQFAEFVVFLEGSEIKSREVRNFELKDDDWQVAYKVYPDRYVMEFALPVSKLFTETPKRGAVFDFNFSRQRKRPDHNDRWDLSLWSASGTSPNNRYRYGHVVFGSFSDRLAVLHQALQQTLAACRRQVTSVSAESQKLFSTLEQELEAFVSAAPKEVNGAQFRELEQALTSLDSRLRYSILSDRNVIVWSSNPMQVPGPHDLPAVDIEDCNELDIRVLGGEWESAALVVSNLTKSTLDGQVLLSDFQSAQGQITVPGWDVLQVRTAPLYHLLTGRAKRDPLPQLQQGDLFRVAPGENELLWLTFKSQGLAPGRYTATMTVRALDDTLSHQIKLVLRVYPLQLGAEGWPRVMSWNAYLRGRTMAQTTEHLKDYYQNVRYISAWDTLSYFKADVDGQVIDWNLDFSKWDIDLDRIRSAHFRYYLIVMSGRRAPFWPIRRAGPADNIERFNTLARSKQFNLERWSPEFNELFGKWILAFRDHMRRKGIAPERWAFYVAGEPDNDDTGAALRETLSFARQAQAVDPNILTYCTIGRDTGRVDLVEMSKYMDIIQVLSVKPATLQRMSPHLKELWHYSILLRNTPYFYYRHNLSANILRQGQVGTGFWNWDGQSQDVNLWRDQKYARFGVLYNHHDNTIVPSLRAEAFREGIEDWKYVLMLDQAIARATNQGVDQALISAAQTFRDQGLSLLVSPHEVYRFRDEARAHLLTLHIALGDFDRRAVAAVEAD